MSILVLCPTRGRPDKLREAAKSLVQTRILGGTRFMAVLDHDEPLLPEYTNSGALYHWLTLQHSGGMVAALNAAVTEILAVDDGPTILGFVGDDHRFRTKGWDREIATALEHGGFAYGNDLYMGEHLPTQVFVTRRIVEALGWMALPDCRHLYVDNAWKDLGLAAGAFYYLPDVVVEHLHPLAQKGVWDEGYRRVNSEQMYTSDGQAFEGWRNGPRFDEDVAKVVQALGRT